jgi:hypothetical protein
MSVVAFPKAKPMIWACNCGCATFELRDDGKAACAICGEHPVGYSGGWYEDIKDGPNRPDDAPGALRDVHGNGSIEFARRRTAQIASEDDAVAIVVLRADGQVTTWSGIDSAARVKWMRAKLKQAAGLIADQAKRFYQKGDAS